MLFEPSTSRVSDRREVVSISYVDTPTLSICDMTSSLRSPYVGRQWSDRSLPGIELISDFETGNSAITRQSPYVYVVDPLLSPIAKPAQPNSNLNSWKTGSLAYSVFYGPFCYIRSWVEEARIASLRNGSRRGT